MRCIRCGVGTDVSSNDPRTIVVLGDDDLPNGLCGDRNDHEPHVHDSTSLGTFWCTADQTDRLPWSREKELQEMVDYE